MIIEEGMNRQDAEDAEFGERKGFDRGNLQRSSSPLSELGVLAVVKLLFNAAI